MTGFAIAATLASGAISHKPVLALTSPKRGFYIAHMKWRNQLLALLCLLVFFALGVLYFENWVVQKPFGNILFIGEGLDPAHLAAARIYAADAATPLKMDTLEYSALLKNYSSDSAIPDEAAAATALATGVKVKNGAIGIGSDGKALSNLLELARQSGRMTGLVTDGRLTSPGAASFYAHAKSKDDRAGLASELVEKANLDVILGGGAADFLPSAKEGNRTDDVDLMQKIAESGYDVAQSADELEEIPRWRRAKLFGVFSTAEMAFADDDVARATQPSLADMVRRGIELLQFNRGGYLLVVDASLMRTAAQKNDGEHTLLQTVELDRAVSVALEYAGTKSTIIVCGDVSVGGMNLSGAPPREASGAIWLGSAAEQGPSLTWATGPNAPNASPSASTEASPPASENPDVAVMPETTATPTVVREPAAIYAPAARAVAADVIALASGPGADALHGTIESTRIFEIIQDNL
ncbi:MAG: alkaline phosphatase [Verrucomicrobiota bacterium]|nr:alkaline phosphatase [Verrucomicrobiota bacterium]